MKMELGSVLQFLEDKTILVTGATGFLAKIFLEKVLRVQPNVKRLFLLLRASDAKAAAHRFHTEVISKDLFRVLKEKWGTNFDSLIAEKVTLVPGDIAYEDLGVKDSDLRDQMLSKVDAVISLAATTKFDERYDVSLGINTLGAKHVLDFAKQCLKMKVFIHVSTAYVCGERGGLIQEKPFQTGETLNGTTGLDVHTEMKLVEEKLTQLRSDGATDATVKLAMRDLGTRRAHTYGWPNTYVFTKAMGEMLVRHWKGNLPVLVLRPTIITSTYKEPFPGWIEGVRTIDGLVMGYGKGKISFFVGDLKAIIDVIPGDMVVNSIIVAMAAHARQPSSAIYQVGSSARNPLRYADIQEFSQRYFMERSWINEGGKPVKVGKVKVLGSMASFQRYMAFRYLLWLKGLQVANAAFCHYFQGTFMDQNRKIEFVMRLVELYRPYLFFKGIFDDMNTEKLRMAARESVAETDMFYFDPKCIEWEDYLMNIHIPGAIKYAFK